MNPTMKRLLYSLAAIMILSGCSSEPIEINLNVRIEHEIRIQVDEELEGLFEEDSELF